MAVSPKALIPAVTPTPATGFLGRTGKAFQAFRSVMFGPGEPVPPDAAQQAEGTRQWQYGVNYNLPFIPRASEGLTPFGWLINIADLYDTARIAIQYRVEEMAAMDWAVVAMDGTKPSKAELDEARQMFEFPDGQHDYAAWIGVAMEEVLVTDAMTISPVLTRKGEIVPGSLELIDGSTVKPLADRSGRHPDPPAPAFEQFLYGRPNWWGTSDELLYWPKNERTRSLYGRSPTEFLIMTINRALRRQTFDLRYYTDSNIPDALVPAPVDYTPEQVQELQGWFDAIIAAPERRRKLHFVPSQRGTMSVFQFKEPILDPAIEEFLDRRAVAAYGVTPNELGWTVDVNRSTSQGQENVQLRRALPYLRFFSTRQTGVLHRAGYKDCKFQYLRELPVEDEDLRNNRLSQQLHDGVLSVDDYLEELGRKTIGAQGHYFYGETLMPIPVGLPPGVNPNPTPGMGTGDPMPEPPPPLAPLPVGPEGNGSGTGGAAGNEQGSDVGTESAAAMNAGGTLNSQQAEDMSSETSGEVVSRMRDLLPEGLVVAAGLAVMAADTGRVLMVQRSIKDEDDPAAGAWEFPGGCLEEGEDSLTGAKREWQEETGCKLPTGKLAGWWSSPNSIYQGFIWLVEHETDVPINPDSHGVKNPDDPDGDDIEVCAWWPVNEIAGIPSLRSEARSTPWSVFSMALQRGELDDTFDEQTPRDRVMTVAHLLDTVVENAKNVKVHADYAEELAERLKDDPLAASLAHNVKHAAKHAGEVVDHAARLLEQFDKYPGVASALKELNEAVPSSEPGEPESVTDDVKRGVSADSLLWCLNCQAGDHTGHVENSPGSGLCGWVLDNLQDCCCPTTPADIERARGRGNRGGLSALLGYWHDKMGQGGGQAGDFDACVAALSKHADKIDDPKALCQWLHIKATGQPAGKAANEKGARRNFDLTAALKELDAWESWALKRVGRPGGRAFRFEALPAQAADALGRAALIDDSKVREARASVEGRLRHVGSAGGEQRVRRVRKRVVRDAEGRIAEVVEEQEYGD